MSANDMSVLKIYLSSTDRFGTILLYEYIVKQARDKGLAGVTVYRGIMGYGLSSSHIDSSRYWELTEKLPVMIEIIDATGTLEKFSGLLEPVLMKVPKGILITIEPVKVVFQKKGKTPS